MVVFIVANTVISAVRSIASYEVLTAVLMALYFKTYNMHKKL